MQVLLALLLWGSSLPTPAQQQQSATAVYRILYHVTAVGSFTKNGKDGLVVQQNVIDTDLAQGTAFAVDPGGWLLTNRHMVDMDELVADFCEKLSEEFNVYYVEGLDVHMALIDIVGNSWPAKFKIDAPTTSEKDVCRSGGRLRVSTNEDWPIQIEKIDTTADLALIRLQQSYGPIAFLGWGRMAILEQESMVYAFGFPEGGVLVMKSGQFLVACEESFGVHEPMPELGSDIIRIVPQFLSRYLMDGAPGMSGGPVIAGDTLVGIITRIGIIKGATSKEIDTVVTFGIPVEYAHAWYLWARGKAKHKPTIVCTPKP